jgi:hypothetical protein
MHHRKLVSITLALLFATSTPVLFGCHHHHHSRHEGPVDRAGDTVDTATETAADVVEGAAHTAGRAVRGAGDTVDEALD